MPTIMKESIMLTAAIDAYKGRKIISVDVPDAFIQTLLPLKPDGERIIMNIRGKLVEWVMYIDPTMYGPLFVIENGHKLLYLNILRAIYGMLEASLLWYKRFRGELEEIGFIFNEYEPCVANRMRWNF